MGSDLRRVEAKLVWLPMAPHEKPKELFTMVGRHLGQILTVQGPLAGDETYDVYQEELQRRQVIINLEQPYAENVAKSIQVNWCKPWPGSQPTPHWWLQLPIEGPGDEFHSVERANLLSFGLGSFYGLNVFMEHFSSVKPPEPPPTKVPRKGLAPPVTRITWPKAEFEFDFERIKVTFMLVKDEHHKKTSNMLSFSVPFISINRILVCKKVFESQNRKNLHNTDLYLLLDHPLLFYTVENDPRHAGIDDEEEEEEDDEDDFLSREEKKLYKETSTHNFFYETPDTMWIRIVEFGDKSHFCSKQDIGLSRVLRLSLDKSYTQLINRFIINSSAEFYFTHVTTTKARSNFPKPKLSDGNFNCFYALRSLLSRSFDIEDQVSLKTPKDVKAINEHLEKYSNENAAALTEALFEIQLALDKGHILMFDRALEKLYKKYCLLIEDTGSLFETPAISNDMVLIRRAVLTLTRVIFLPPQAYLKSLIFRNFDPDFALRVSVRDDNFEKLAHTIKGSKDAQLEFLIENLKEELIEGLKMGPRRYEFVGCSASQLRDHGFLMYAEDNKGETSHSLREHIGQLERIRQIPKYMARMGQAFSQSLSHIKVPESCCTLVPDIQNGMNPESKKPYCFSDGIGQISQELAEVVYAKLKLDDIRPSSMQIRYAGCKGMLTVTPELDGKQVIFRESMNKFESSSNSLEILKCSCPPRFVYLNRPFITILEGMGVPKEVFLKLQEEMLLQYCRSFIYEEDAVPLLEKYSHIRLPYRKLSQHGVKITHEPFFRAMLQAIIRKQIGDLKQKARILIPPHFGRTMFGVLDETHSLRYGEVFVQLSTSVTEYRATDPTTILDGTIIVTKNPCMHPGDVRKFKAVDIEDLHHIKDCIVFPAVGRRPHPDEMAGSDLDGDEYSVIWHPDLIFQCDNFEPMNFPYNPAKELDRPVQVEDMADFFCTYIQKDCVGTLANAHLVWADYLSEGIFSKKCMRIARSYSISVDFAKTGVAAEITRGERPHTYPDFMEKNKEKNTYLSVKALGELFRNCRRLEACLEFTECDVKFEPDPSLIHPDWEKYRETAEQALRAYSTLVQSNLNHYGIESEGELMSGSVLKYSKYFGARSDVTDLSAILDFQVNTVFDSLREKYFREVENDEEEAYKMASAWYMVTYEANRFTGLPWVLSERLLQLKIVSQHVGRAAKDQRGHLLQEKIDAQIPRGDLSTRVEEVILSWLDTNANFFTTLGTRVSEMKPIAINEARKELKKALRENPQLSSPGQALLRILECYIKTGFFLPHTKIFNPQLLHLKNLGLMAIVTLIRMSATCNPSYLLSLNSAMDCARRGWETVRIPLPNELADHFICEENSVREFLMRQAPVAELLIRPMQGKNNQWYAMLLIKGSLWDRERFKDLVVQPWFPSAVMRGHLPRD
ncbi:hypothetical protein LAZ67_3001852, partial [Cordylochernes scorpioides]